MDDSSIKTDDADIQKTEQQVVSQTEQKTNQTKECQYCGGEISINAKKCKFCGEWVTDKTETTEKDNTQPISQVIVNQTEHESNGVGVAGFVTSLVCLVFGWVPGVGFILWLIGLLLSFIGIFKKPRGLAIAGLIISNIGIVIIISIFGTLAAIFK